jgi:hypothetical protein
MNKITQIVSLNFPVYYLLDKDNTQVRKRIFLMAIYEDNSAAYIQLDHKCRMEKIMDMHGFAGIYLETGLY